MMLETEEIPSSQPFSPQGLGEGLPVLIASPGVANDSTQAGFWLIHLFDATDGDGLAIAYNSLWRCRDTVRFPQRQTHRDLQQCLQIAGLHIVCRKSFMAATLLKTETTESAGSLEHLREKLLQHPLYDSVRTVDSLRLFMREHVFAVWDFMSLLKRLQQVVTCCEVPWVPVADASIARFINEIVLGEECDEDGRGGFSSHFELYLSAMEEIGAETLPIRSLISQVQHGISAERALEDVSILPSTRAFVRSTLGLTNHGQPHQVAAAFFYGREDVIPDMFSRLVQSLPQHGVPVERLDHYLRRHIELDANDHGPLARKLVSSLCGDQSVRENEARATAIQAISLRISLWDGILAEIQSRGL